MNQQMRINLIFGADTSLAQQNIQALGASLRQLSATPIGFDTGGINRAVADVKQLQIHLQNAVNVNTGKLDLTKLNASLKMSKTNLTQLSSSLLSLGPAGQQSFTQLAMAISQAEAPLYRFSAATRSLFKTFGNTLKWQLASSAIHGITGAISESISYIEKFDKALTDIKIVSTLNDKELISFAETARKIAKDVNGTALDIAQGATIFFQQGLDAKDVEERVAIVQKMANITGETAETVSSQMTAIWNNFSDGTETLESYADTLAYLGARTAADTNQIATAMEKFAASAKTVGLSYEYAAAAVAQVIDRTQMAPEEVGTAMKTILSRMQGLELGETLEDGVDLNKYSEALKVIGVDILDANNQLRDADSILNDLGDKWDTLDSAQKKALATTVAGVRQQTQFIALMEEWDDIESSVAGLGEGVGYLGEKNKEWANSIEGIKKKYEDAKQSMFDSLLSEDTIKGFYEGMTSIVKVVDQIAKSFGGLGPMLKTVLLMFSGTLIPKLMEGTKHFLSNISTAFGFTGKQVNKLQNDFFRMADAMKAADDFGMSKSTAMSLTLSKELTITKERLIKQSRNLSGAEKELVELKIQGLEKDAEILQKEIEKQAVLEQQLKIKKEMLMAESRETVGTNIAINKYREARKTSGANETETENIIQGAQDNSMISLQNALQQREKPDLRASAINAVVEERKKREQEVLIELKNQQTEIDKQVQKLSISGESEEKRNKAVAEQLRLQKEIKAKKEEIDSIEDNIKSDYDAETNQLREMIKLKTNMVKESSNFTDKTVLGKSEVSTYVDKGAQRGGAQIFKNMPGVDTDQTIAKDNLLTFTMDTSVANLEALIAKENELSSASSKLSTMQTELKMTLSQVDEAAQKEEAQIKKSGKSTGDMQRQTQKAQEQARNFANEVDKMVKSLKGIKGQDKPIKNVQKALNLINKKDAKMSDVKAGLDILQTELKETGIAVDTAKGLTTSGIDAMVNSLKKAGVSGAALDALEQALREAGLWTDQLSQKFNQLRGSMQNTSTGFSGFAAGMSGLLSGLGRLAGSAQMAMSGINMLKSAFTEAQTPGEALTNYLMGLSMILPVVAAGFDLLSKMKKKDTADTIKNTGANALNETQEKKGLIATAWAAAAKAWKAAVENFGFAGAIIGAVAATAILGALIGGAVAAFSAGAAKEEKANEEENAAATAKALTEELSRAKQEAEDLKSSFDDYNSIADKLANCKKGTEEWTEALIENNEKVVELMEKYPKLAKYVSMGSDGQLIISAEGQQEMLQWASQKVAKAQLASYSNTKRENEKEIDQLEKDTGTYIEYKTERQKVGTETKYVVNAAGTGYTTQTVDVYEDVEVAVEKGVPKVVREAADVLINKYGINDALNHISEVPKEQEEIVKNLITKDIELMNAMQENTQATIANSQVIGSQIMAGHSEYEKSNYKENIAMVAGYATENTEGKDIAGTYDDGTYEKILDLFDARKDDGEKWIGDEETKEGKAQKDLFLEFLEGQYGLDADYWEKHREDFDFQDGKVQGKVYVNGEEQEFTWTDEQIASNIIANRQGEAGEERGVQFAKQINSFENEDQADIFTAAITGNNAFLSPELLQKSEDSLNDIIDSMEISKDTFEAMGDEAKKFGEEFNEDWVNNFKNYEREIVKSQKAFKDLKVKASGALGEIEKEAINNAKAIEEGNYKWSEAAEENAKQVSKSLSEALGAEADLGLDAAFINENIGIINDFIDGVEGSGERLQEALYADAVIDITTNINDEETKQVVTGLHQYLVDNLEKQDFTVGVAVDEGDFFNKCQSIIEAAGMTQEQAQEYFGKLGFDVEGNTDTVKKNTKHKVKWPIYDETGVTVEDWGEFEWTDTTEYEVFSLKSITPNASYGGNVKNVGRGLSGSTTPRKTNSGNGSGGGGNSNKNKGKKQETNKEDIVTRYKEVDDAIKIIQDTIEDTSRVADTLWGTKRLSQMKKINEQLYTEVDLLKKKKNEILSNLSADKLDLISTLNQNFGLQFNIDPITGNILNYTEIMTQLYTQLKEYENHYNSLINNSEAQDNYSENTLEPFKEKIDKVTNAINTYEETLGLLLETDNEIQEKLVEWQTANYEQINYKVEFKIEISDSELERIDYYIAKMENNLFKSAETLAQYGKKIEPLKNNIEIYTNMVDELQDKFANGEITQADYIEGLQEAQSELIANTEELQSLLEEIGEYYLNVLSEVNDKIDAQTEKFDNFSSLIEHYKNIVSLTGGEKDFVRMNKILKSEEKILENTISVSKARVDMLETQRTKILRELKKTNISQEYKDKLEEDLREIENLITSEESNIMDAIMRLSEIALETLNNTLGQARQAFEQTLTGDISLDAITSQIERLNAKQEEYLTTTNKLYETNKLIRQAQLDMDKTDNQRAKQHYNDYIKYIEQLQQSGQLSQFELELAQAEYDILQKKIALEEAQEAKNQVRLTRDAEGNYGYVYTANQDNISKAEQEFADAENARYNIALEAAQNYQDQYWQAIADMRDALDELEQERAEKLITEEEYEARKLEITETYLSIAQTAHDLYYKATGVMMEESAENRLDYTLKGVEDMETLYNATEEYLDASEKAFDQYDKKIEEVTKKSEENFGKVEKGINKVVKESEKLAETITDELIPALEDELNDTLEASIKQWKEVELAVKAARKEVENYMTTIGKKITEESIDYEGISDYSQEMYNRISSGDYYTQQELNALMDARWKKMGGIDNYNYTEMMENANDPIWDQVYQMLRDYKIENTDWMGLIQQKLASGDSMEDVAWMIAARDEKLANNNKEKTSQQEVEKWWADYQASHQTDTQNGITDSGQFEYPLSSYYNKTPNGGSYGASRDGGKRSHGGQDIACPEDTPVLAARSGTVTTAKASGGYGRLIIIDHGDGYSTYYAHLHTMNVSQGDTVSQGQQIGLSGGSGVVNGKINENAYGKHLHFEIRYNGKTLNPNSLVSLDTGGYTGDWGPEGKIAMLHQKELILNAKDTENFLTATNILREISDMLDQNALVASLGAINLRAMTLNTPADQVLQQEVTIHADFPNVTDHNEIELAIDNLINAASQHAYRT